MAQTMNADERMLMVLLRAGIMGTVPRELPQGVNMRNVYHLSSRQNVMAIAHDGIKLLSQHFDLGMNETLAMSWEFATINCERTHERHRRVIMALRDFYHEHGIRMMVLKGWSQSLFYPNPRHRAGGDIDIYLYGDHERADALVESEKHTPIDYGHHHHTLFKVGGELVENHYDFINVVHVPNAAWLETQLKRLAAEEPDMHDGVCLPPPTFNALFLMRHAAQHFAGECMELKYLIDWQMMRKHQSDRVRWDEVRDIARSVGLLPFMQCFEDACDALFDDKPLEGMSLKVWDDIWHPAFGHERPYKNTVADWCYRGYRWYRGLWKRRFVYPDALCRQFLSLAWSHIKKPDIPPLQKQLMAKNANFAPDSQTLVAKMINSKLNKLTSWYFTRNALPYWGVLLADCFIVVVCSTVMHALRIGTVATLNEFWQLEGSLLCYLLFYIAGFRMFHTYEGVLRYSSFIDLMRVAYANTVGIAGIFIIRHVVNIDLYLTPIAWRELAGTFIAGTALMWAIRILIKYQYDIFALRGKQQYAFIYGTEEVSVAIAKSMRSQESRFVIRGFVSDDQTHYHHMLLGVKIYPNDDRLVERMAKKNATALIVSPSKAMDLRDNQAMVSWLTQAGVHIMMYAGVTEWSKHTDASQPQLREVEIEDLLPRNEITVDLDAVQRELTGKTILITGAAGSIGSEIVRQVAQFAPSRIVLVDQAETPLHDMRLWLARNWPNLNAPTITASICNEAHMEYIFALYRPAYVFHAAAFKHVPMMEDNPGESIYNNVQGTRIIADLAVKYGTLKFVMVSTDKAVNPTNVMGCSKRICEMYCQSLNARAKTRFITTRFGNVLGSNGSVIPLFREQIKAGGPVTVTHPDIIRFFMLIPEACQLVLTAGTMGKGGEIFVFDMGKPVKIAELARRMITLSGASGVEIKYTGLRDGEKLYEELLADDENTMPSIHPKIKIAKVRELDYDEVNSAIDELVSIAARYDDMATVAKMKELVPEFLSRHSKYEVLDTLKGGG